MRREGTKGGRLEQDTDGEMKRRPRKWRAGIGWGPEGNGGEERGGKKHQTQQGSMQRKKA